MVMFNVDWSFGYFPVISGTINLHTHFSSASLINRVQGSFASIFQNDTSNDNVIGAIFIYLGVSPVDGACLSVLSIHAKATVDRGNENTIYR